MSLIKLNEIDLLWPGMVCLDINIGLELWFLNNQGLVMIPKQQYQPMETSQVFEMTDFSRGE